MLSEFQKRKLARKFQLFDARRSGRIGWADIERVLENVLEISDAMGPEERTEFLLKGQTGWQLLAAAADVDRNGVVDLEEWFAFYDRVIYGRGDPSGSMPPWLAELEDRSFRLMDQNGDDRISLPEYSTLLGAYGVRGDLATCFSHIDTDCDGYLSRAEWNELNVSFYLGRDPLASSAWLWGDIYGTFFK